MSCECLKVIEDKLKEHHKADVHLDLKTVVDMKTFELSAALPPLYYRYQAGKKTKKSYVTFAFCPFCGEKR